MTLLSLALATGVTAAQPTRETVSSAQFTRIGSRKHKNAGTVEISKAQVGDLPCFRGQAHMEQVNPDIALEVLLDIEAAPQWSSAGLTEAKTLHRNESSIEFYEYLDIPGWTMVADRFWFVRGTWERTGDAVSFWWDRMEGGGPHATTFDDVLQRHPRAVEPPVNIGNWSFEPRGDRVAVTYTVCTDPGGSLPQAIQNFATRRTLPDTVAEMVAEARRRQGEGS